MRIKKHIEELVERFDSWRDHLPPERWALYQGVISEATRREIPFAVGGGLAAMAYAGQLRDTKDIDLYIRREQREAMIQVLEEAGWRDYYETLPYDRNWIFRSCKDDSILDVMWAMANQRAQVDDEWLDGPTATVRDVTFRLVRPEETLWSKLYVMQRDRCDWPDAMSMLYSVGSELDWERLLRRTGEDTPLLAALVATFRWVSPDVCGQFPPWLWRRLGLAEIAARGTAQNRATLLDGRPWFTPNLDEEHRL